MSEVSLPDIPVGAPGGGLCPPVRGVAQSAPPPAGFEYRQVMVTKLVEVGACTPSPPPSTFPPTTSPVALPKLPLPPPDPLPAIEHVSRSRVKQCPKRKTRAQRDAARVPSQSSSPSPSPRPAHAISPSSSVSPSSRDGSCNSREALKRPRAVDRTPSPPKKTRTRSPLLSPTPIFLDDAMLSDAPRSRSTSPNPNPPLLPLTDESTPLSPPAQPSTEDAFTVVPPRHAKCGTGLPAPPPSPTPPAAASSPGPTLTPPPSTKATTPEVVFLVTKSPISHQQLVLHIRELAPTANIISLKRLNALTHKFTCATLVDRQRLIKSEPQLHRLYPGAELLLELPPSSVSRPPPRAMLQVVAKGVPLDFTPEFILSEVKRNDPSASSATRITNFRSREPTSFIRITVGSESGARALRANGVLIGLNRYKCEEPVNKPGGVRCYNCQAIGHVARACRGTPACSFCGVLSPSPAHLASCPRYPSHPKCVNCPPGFDHHPSSWSQCPAWLANVTRNREAHAARRGQPLPNPPPLPAPPTQPAHGTAAPTRRPDRSSSQELPHFPPSTPTFRPPAQLSYARATAPTITPSATASALTQAAPRLRSLVDDAIRHATRQIENTLLSAIDKIGLKLDSALAELEQNHTALAQKATTAHASHMLELGGWLQVSPPAPETDIEQVVSRHFQSLDAKLEQRLSALTVRVDESLSRIEALRTTLRNADIHSSDYGDTNSDEDDTPTPDHPRRLPPLQPRAAKMAALRSLTDGPPP